MGELRATAAEAMNQAFADGRLAGAAAELDDDFMQELRAIAAETVNSALADGRLAAALPGGERVFHQQRSTTFKAMNRAFVDGRLAQQLTNVKDRRASRSSDDLDTSPQSLGRSRTSTTNLGVWTY